MTHFANADTDDPGGSGLADARAARAVRRGRRAVVAAGAPVQRAPRGEQLRRAAVPRGAVRSRALRDRDLRQRPLGAGAGRAGDAARHRDRAAARGAGGQRRSATAPRGAQRATAVSRSCRVGYADGLPRRASGHAEAAIRGKRVPLVGLISMDIAMADVTDVPDAQVGDAAVLLGRASGGVVDHRGRVRRVGRAFRVRGDVRHEQARAAHVRGGRRGEHRGRRRADERRARSRRPAPAPAPPPARRAGRLRRSRVGKAVVGRASRTRARRSVASSILVGGHLILIGARSRGCRAGRSAARTTSRPPSTSALAGCRSCCSSARSPAW